VETHRFCSGDDHLLFFVTAEPAIGSAGGVFTGGRPRWRSRR
jgi:hypothetical protein